MPSDDSKPIYLIKRAESKIVAGTRKPLHRRKPFGGFESAVQGRRQQEDPLLRRRGSPGVGGRGRSRQVGVRATAGHSVPQERKTMVGSGPLGSRHRCFPGK